MVSSPLGGKNTQKTRKQVYRRVSEVYKTAAQQVPKNRSSGQFKKRVIGSYLRNV